MPKFNKEMKAKYQQMLKKFLLGLISPILLFIIFEGYLRFSQESKVTIAQKTQGVPAVGTLLLLANKIPSKILPLGGISKQKTILCNEGEGWTSYKADRYGFPNNDKVWDQDNIELAFIGDSYIQGACVPKGSSFVDLFNKNQNVINGSSFGHGPLGQLGVFLEYILDKKPQKVIISYVANDLFIDLNLETSHPILKGYLNNRIQNLKSKQEEIDLLYQSFIEDQSQHIEDDTQGLQVIHLFRKFSLEVSRKQPNGSGYITDYQRKSEINNLMMYHKILQKINQIVSTWGGKTYLISIPDAGYFSSAKLEQTQKHYKTVKQITKSAGIHWINLADMFDKEDNPYEFYNPLSGFYGHFNIQGQQKAYQFIKDEITR